MDASPTPAPDFAPLLQAASQRLTEALGQPIHLTHADQLSEAVRRNLLLRCYSAPQGAAPASYILKQVKAEVYDPTAVEAWDTQRFFSDWAGAQFLSELPGDPHHAPRFYVGDRDLGFIVLEDLGPHRSLVQPLLEGDAVSATAALLRFSTRLGELHAATVGTEAAFERVFRAITPNGKTMALQAADMTQRVAKLEAPFAELGLSLDAATLAELQTLIQTVVTPGPFWTYLHADPCPDNVFDDGTHLRLIDFEFGYFGFALRDAVYARMTFPSCWCANRLPPAVIAQMENQYRTALSVGCPAAQDDAVFEHGLATACGLWLIFTLTGMLEKTLQEDRPWGIAGLRARMLARLAAFITTAETLGHFPAFRATAHRLHTTLSQRWPEVATLPLYPAFQAEAAA